MRGRLSLLSLVAVLAVLAGPVSASALAEGSSGTSTAAGGTPNPAGSNSTPSSNPAPAARASLHMYVRDAFVVHGNVVTVPRRGFTVQGYVRPYVPGQKVQVKSWLGHRLIKTDVLRIKPADKARVGAFSERVAGPGAGIIRVDVSHAATAGMLGFAGQRAVAALNRSIGFGSRGQFVELIQQRLSALHIYLPMSGVYDEYMRLAVDAYHRLLGWGVSESLGGATISALLDGRGAFHVRHPGDGKHVEGNLGSQLLALIYGNRVYRIYPISSGKPSTPTILGHFRVYQRDPGYLPDGMYYSNFFSGGYAIHGYSPAPDYPASHGCMRLPIIDAISVYDWLNYGDVVDVYR